MSKKSAALVLVQVILLGYFVISGIWGTQLWQHILLICGFGLVVWAMLSMRIGNFNVQPELRSKSLITAGPYRIIRHPMYTGILMMLLPGLIHHFTWYKLMAYILLVLIFLEKMKMEEEFLAQRFRESFYRYKQRSFRLLPWIY